MARWEGDGDRPLLMEYVGGSQKSTSENKDFSYYFKLQLPSSAKGKGA